MNYPDTYSKEEQLEMDRQYEMLLDAWKGEKKESDVELVRKAYEFAALAHKDARRKSGEPYIIHPLAVAEIVDTARNTGAGVAGPIPLPTNIHKYTIQRSVHVDKKSREQFEMRVHKRLMDILDPTQQTVDALGKLSLPAGVDVEIKL